MKKFLIITSLLFLSCSESDEDRISKVEEFLGVDLPTNYKMEYSSDIAIHNPVDMTEITLEEKDFDELFKKVDTTNFEKIGINYFKSTKGKGNDVKAIVLSTKMYTIRYSEKF